MFFADTLMYFVRSNFSFRGLILFFIYLLLTFWPCLVLPFLALPC